MQSVRDLFWKQKALVGAGFHGGEQFSSRFRATRCELVVGTLAGQQRPRSTDSCPIEGAAVSVLAVSIAVVPMPQRSEWRGDFQNAINHANGIDDPWIVWRSQSEPDKSERIWADEFADRRVGRRPRPVLDRDKSDRRRRGI